MRWVVLADDWPPQLGGVATWGFGAAAGLSEAGCEVRVFCRHRPALESPTGSTVTGVRGRSFGRRGAWWTAARASLELARADAVLATTWGIAAVAGPWLRRRGIPLHLVFHGSDATRAPRDRRALADLAASAHCWAVSDFLVDALRERGVAARWIPSPVEVGPTAYCRDGAWVFVARATPLKGGDRFVRIVGAAGVRGRVIGGGPALAQWRALADRIGAHIDFLGPLDRAATARALDGAAVVALLSRADPDGDGAEGLGLTLLEGAARGLLPVGCTTGGIPEVAQLVLDDPDDGPRSAVQIQAALAGWDPASRQLLTRHGRAAVALALLSTTS